MGGFKLLGNFSRECKVLPEMLKAAVPVNAVSKTLGMDMSASSRSLVSLESIFVASA